MSLSAKLQSYINKFICLLSFASQLQFNIKMSRQKQTHAPYNWTDQRLQEIMKKYEQPLQAPTKSINRKPLATRNSYQVEENERQISKSPWRNNFFNEKTPTGPRKEFQPGSNKPFEPSFPKENYEPARASQRPSLEGQYIRQRPKYSNKKEGYYQNEQSYDEKYSFNPSQFLHHNDSKNKEDDLFAAKQYLELQERKYLKTEMIESSSSKRQRTAERENIKPGRYQQLPYQERSWAEPERTNVEYAPRITNIERINNKIKQILEFNKTTITQTPRQDSSDAYSNRMSFRNQMIFSNKNNQRLEVTPGKIGRTSEFQPCLQSQSRAENDTRKLEQRSKSCLALKKKIVVSGETPKQAHKADEHIINFNNKIAQYQESKRKLNITFNRCQKQTLKTSPDEPLNGSFGRTNNQRRPEAPETHYKCKTETFELLDEQINQDTSLFQSPYIDLKELDSQNQSINIENPQEEHNEVEKGIQFRKKKLSQLPYEGGTSTFSESKRLLQMISEQVQLDSQLRLTKNWFTNSSQQASFTLLQELLCQRWREMSMEEVRSEFQINFEEEDPFYSYRADQFEIEDLVANYIICHKHWSEKIEGQWDVAKLKEEHFFEKLDLQRKGFLQIEDLVREINMNEGVFYRNRDLYLTFQRFQLSENGKLGEEQMYSALSQK